MIHGFKKDIFSKSKIHWNTDINKEDLDKIKIIDGLKLNSRPAEISPEIYYKIAEIFEKS